MTTTSFASLSLDTLTTVTGGTLKIMPRRPPPETDPFQAFMDRIRQLSDFHVPTPTMPRPRYAPGSHDDP